MTERDRRLLIEVQIRGLVDQPGRLYDLIHALIEECYRRAEPAAAPESDQHWRDVARGLTIVERIVASHATVTHVD